MLSETTQSGTSTAALALRQVLFTRNPTVKLVGAGVAAGLQLLVAGLLLASPSEMQLSMLLVIPVAGAGWFGGVWVGRSVAVAGVAGHLGSQLLSGVPIEAPLVLGGMATLIVLLLVAGAVSPLRFAAQSYRDHAQVDPLTNLGNRRFFREIAAVELHRSKRYTRPVSLVSLDAEGFERLRHVIGGADCDLLLVQMASVMTGALRTSDVVARISGAEFAILLPETDGAGARVVAEKLRRRLTDTATAAGHRLTFRASVVGFAVGPVSPDAMFRQADEAMADARRSGPEALTYRDYEHPPMQLV